MFILKCKECGDELEGDVLSSSTLTCDKCGGFRTVKDPKEGVPSMSFFDNGSGKKKVL
jgi:translation initiation factor 2 beta subunit (eIF-2beta)/eIF-5